MIVEQVPESEESLEEEIEPIIEEEVLEAALKAESPEAETETASPAIAHVPVEDLKKAEYRKKLEDRKRAGEIKVEEEKPPEEKKSFFKKVVPKVGFAQKAKALVFNREVYLDNKDLEEPLWELEMGLLESDLALSVSEAIVESVKNQLTGTSYNFV